MQRALSREWRRWLVENLLLGIAPPELVKVLVNEGLSEAAARAAIDAETSDPCFLGGYKATSMQRKLEGLMDAYGELHRQAPWHRKVERRAALSAEELLQRYSLYSRPVIARKAFPALTASGALRLRARRVWIQGDSGSAPPRQAKTDLLLYQVRGRRPLALIPWCDLLAIRGRTGAERTTRALQLRVSLGAGEALLIPVGWWYRSAGRASGAAVCYQAGDARAPAVAWREQGAVIPTAPPRARL